MATSREGQGYKDICRRSDRCSTLTLEKLERRDSEQDSRKRLRNVCLTHLTLVLCSYLDDSGRLLLARLHIDSIVGKLRQRMFAQPSRIYRRHWTIRMMKPWTGSSDKMKILNSWPNEFCPG